MPYALLLPGLFARRRSLTRRLALLAGGLVLGPPLLLLAVLAGITDPPPAGALPGPAGPVPASLAASDALQVAAVPPALRGDFLTAARTYAIPPALLAAVGHVESGFRPDAVGPPVPGGPAEGMMQFLPSSWTLFNTIPGASPFDPGPAVLAAARHLLSSGALPGGGFDAAAGLFGYNHSHDYVALVLSVAAGYGYTYDPNLPPATPVRYHYPLPTRSGPPTAGGGGRVLLPAAAGTGVLACVRGNVVTVAAAGGRLSVVLRGEDGFLYTYDDLSATVPGLRGGPALRPGSHLEPGAPLGTAAGPVGFTVRRQTGATPLDPRPYLASWPTTPASPTAAATQPGGPPAAPAVAVPSSRRPGAAA